jgi:hypothetical protein
MTTSVRAATQCYLSFRAHRMPLPPSPVICAHCRRPQVGRASLSTEDGLFHLCHPNEGMDCYVLVTRDLHEYDGSCSCVERDCS